MDPFDFDSLKAEKATAIFQNNHFKNIARLFRIVEIFLGLVFFSWTSTRLPFAVKISSEYFRLLITIIISPLFIFVLCNLIVLTLLFEAGNICSGAQSSTLSSSETERELYEGFIKTSENCINLTNDISSPILEIEYPDKQTIFGASNTRTVSIGNTDASEVAETFTDEASGMTIYRRSQSEHLDVNRECVDKQNHGKFRRSETEKCRIVANPGEVPEETVYIFDELSNEEFRKAIEAFIAKQIKFHQEEKLAIVLHSHT